MYLYEQVDYNLKRNLFNYDVIWLAYIYMNYKINILIYYIIKNIRSTYIINDVLTSILLL